MGLRRFCCLLSRPPSELGLAEGGATHKLLKASASPFFVGPQNRSEQVDPHVRNVWETMRFLPIWRPPMVKYIYIYIYI